jgi:hypothetical protein
MPVHKQLFKQDVPPEEDSAETSEAIVAEASEATTVEAPEAPETEVPEATEVTADQLAAPTDRGLIFYSCLPQWEEEGQASSEYSV